jgi:putative heme-binding domain-containing protein
MAVPGEGQVALDDQGNWRFPEGSVLVRTVFIEAEPGNPASQRRAETQILHFEAEAWRPYSYVWNDDQTDADLVGLEGTTKTIGVDGKGGRHEMTYRVHARSECVLCHNPWVERKTTIFGVQSASPLAVNTPELNKRNGDGGSASEQLEALYQMGLLAFRPEPAKLPRLVDPYDQTADLDRRARSYLQTNCAHCHQFNAGGAANIALGYDVPLDATKTVGVRPIQGTFNISGARIIAPGDPEGSVLYYRVSKLGGGRMPRAGSNRVDERATRLIHDWIAGMKGGPNDAAPAGGLTHTSAEERAAFESLGQADGLSRDARMAAIRRLALSTRGALMLLGLMDGGHASELLLRDVVAITRNSPQVEVRDLFERFVPENERVKRLGDAIDRGSILALRGDAGRGRQVFATNPAAQCKSCHKLDGVGENVGPDLAKVGAKYNKPALLEQILEPSKSIDPQYVAHTIETKDGRVITGLVVEKTDQSVVIRDAQAKTVQIPKAEIERLAPQSRSLMPELLLRDLTAQEVADLLEFLATLR